MTGSSRKVELSVLGIEGANAHWNLSVAALYEEAIRRGEGTLTADGPLVCLSLIHISEPTRPY